MAAKPESKFKLVADNRKARFNYAIDEVFEAGVALTGSEVKSLRAGKATIAESYADARDGEIWQPATSTIGWDEGKAAYTIKLDEILSRKVQARAIEYRAKDGKWSPMVVEATTAALKDVTDGPLGTASRVSDMPAGSNIASFCISPDGKLIAYALVEPDGQGKPKSRLYMSRADGVGGSTGLTDGRQLDLTPAQGDGSDVFPTDPIAPLAVPRAGP